jgi:hypothetical protein
MQSRPGHYGASSIVGAVQQGAAADEVRDGACVRGPRS